MKRVKFKSAILSKWWGQPIYLGATVLLPKEYEKHPGVEYPVNYSQGHFSARAPGGFGSGGAFDALWLAEDTPRFLYVTFQHPSPYYDDSYVGEFREQRAVRRRDHRGAHHRRRGPLPGDPRAVGAQALGRIDRRMGSAGAADLLHLDFFGGTWASCPDSVDFRAHQIVNIYSDDNAYFLDRGWTKVERPNQRTPDGAITSMMKDENWFELVSGDKSRSGGQWDIWEATFSPAGPDGYPAPIWDKRTGKIDKQAAAYWKEHYDLRAILERDWKTLGPKLVGKLNIYVGDDDSFYLDNGVELMEKFLESTKTPYYAGSVTYKRGAPHCWGPPAKELLDAMARHIERWAPAGADITSWRYR